MTGARDLAWVEASRRDAAIGSTRWRVVGFEHEMADVWSACDVAVCRAGATTVAELCATGVPSVLVPLPGAPGGHQDANATVLAGAGAAVVVADGELSGDALDEVLGSLLDDPSRLATMAKSASGLARPDAAERVARVVLDHAR